jgi:hypothetical protein
VPFPQKVCRTHYAKFVFLHPVESGGHIEHFSASEMRNVDALCFMLGWDLYGFHKKRVEHIMLNWCFFHPVGSVGNVVHSGASGA